jgi:hypothetical protein
VSDAPSESHICPVDLEYIMKQTAYEKWYPRIIFILFFIWEASDWFIKLWNSTTALSSQLFEMIISPDFLVSKIEFHSFSSF